MKMFKNLSKIIVAMVIFALMISCKSGSNVAKGTAGSVSNEKPKYVFMFIGDGLSHVQANAARVYLGNNTVGEVELANLVLQAFL